MPTWPISDDEARAMYAGGRANDAAKWFARLWGKAFATGITPRRWVTLEVRGRRSGRLMRIPVGLADVDRRWYLVSMLGECNWVRNVRAADGRARLQHGRRIECTMLEVPIARRGPILKRYVDVAPGGRPHIPVPMGSPTASFDAIAAAYPVFEVFRVVEGRSEPFRPPRSWFPLAVTALAVGASIAWRGRRPSSSRRRYKHRA